MSYPNEWQRTYLEAAAVQRRMRALLGESDQSAPGMREAEPARPLRHRLGTLLIALGTRVAGPEIGQPQPTQGQSAR